MSGMSIDSSTVSSLASDFLSQMMGNKGAGDEDFASSFVSEKDTDGDDLLTLEEAGIDSDQFSNADTDGDGSLSVEEIQADVDSRKLDMQGMVGELSVSMQSGGAENLAQSILSDKDEDGDGSLSLDESGLDEELFSAFDADGDGTLSSEEISEAVKPPELSEQTAASGTGGGAGSDSTEESEEEYDAYDLNQDGYVSMEELRQAMLDGDTSLENLFADEQTSTEDQSTFMRKAMQAYQAQMSESAFSGMQEAIV